MKKDTTLHIRLDKALKEELENISNSRKSKLSKIIRIALEEYVEYNFLDEDIDKESKIYDLLPSRPIQDSLKIRYKKL
jgi:metal-responsive CopG/Arc/MetJ family transcriptional regulator